MQRNLTQLLVIGILLSCFQAKAQENDTLKLLQVERLNLSSNTSNTNLTTPSFTDYANGFKLGYKFSTNQFNDIAENLAFTPKSSYAGFQINFIFKSNLFKDSLSRARNKLTFAFEAGTSDAKLYNIRVNDTTRFTYNFKSNIFRVTFGYKHFISKKGRFRFYTGVELVNEFNISAAVFENEFRNENGISVQERKLFARKGYNLYVISPSGFDYRLFKKGSLFFNINLGIGFENLDPLRAVNIYSGARLGFSLAI